MALVKKTLSFLTLIGLVAAQPILAMADPAQADRPAQDGRQIRCTFAQCYAESLKRSPLVLAANLSLDAYELKVKEAHTAWLPKFEISGFASALPTQKAGTDGSNPFYDYNYGPSSLGPILVGSLSLAQPLYSFGKISDLRDLAAQGVEIGIATRRIAADEMRYQLSRAYWGLAMVAELQDMVTEGKKLLDEQRRKVEQLRDEADDRFNQSDLLRLKILIADFEDKMRGLERGRQQAQDGLRMALNTSTATVFETTSRFDAIEFPLQTTEFYEQYAAAHNPKLQALLAGSQARAIQVQLAKDQLWPDLVFVGRLAGTYAPSRATTQDSIATNPNNTATSGIGVALRWNTDIFRLWVKVDQAEVDWHAQVLQEQGERSKALMELRQVYRELADMRAMLEVQRDAMKAARGWLTAEQQRYEDGFADDMTEVQRAVEAYYRRRVTYFEAILNYNVQVAALSRAVGTDVVAMVGPNTTQPVNITTQAAESKTAESKTAEAKTPEAKTSEATTPKTAAPPASTP